MKVGDKIKIPCQWGGFVDEVYVVEEFRYCLGIFLDDNYRKAGDFTPLCEIYERGAESENGYISNYGNYVSNEVQAWIDIF